VFVRGRRRVGKSRLIEEFCTQSGCAYVFFAASKAGPNELGLFAEEIAQSNLPGRALFAGSNPSTWDAALRLLAATLDPTAPTIVVFDEFPYLVDEDSGIEGTFQKHWDQLLSKKPVLLLLIGSDLAMMEALNTHSRPLYQRGVDMIVPPLSPVETAAIVGSSTPSDGVPPFMGDGRIAFAPVEDLAFGFALVVLTLVLWVWLGRRGVERTPYAGPPRFEYPGRADDPRS
jgi:hypothetical protein